MASFASSHDHPNEPTPVVGSIADSLPSVSGASPRRVVAVIDFVGLRVEPPVTALGLHERGFRTVELICPPFARVYDAARYAAALLEPHPSLASEVAVVVAYCMSGSVAQEVAVALSSPEFSVPLVVLDGEPVTEDAIRDQWGIALRRIAEMVGADFPASAPRALSRDEVLARPTEIAREIHGTLTSVGTSPERNAWGERAGGRDVEIFADWFADWLGYLIAAHNAEWPQWDGDVLQVVSSAHPVTRWVGCRSEEIVHVPVERQCLPLDPGAKAAVLTFIAERAGNEGGQR